jgi:hypothetical protein
MPSYTPTGTPAASSPFSAIPFAASRHGADWKIFKYVWLDVGERELVAGTVGRCESRRCCGISKDRRADDIRNSRCHPAATCADAE